MSLDRNKARLRAEARARRDVAAEAASSDAASRMAAHFVHVLPLVGIGPGAVVAGYWPTGSEMDPRPLLGRLSANGCRCALPVVVGRDAALIFRRWRPGMALQSGFMGIPHPGPEAAELRPDMVIAPLLAFDKEGGRLGQGGGHYDRTLAELRRTGRVVAAGAAYAAQRVDSVPHGAHDQRLSWIVTEDGAQRTKR